MAKLSPESAWEFADAIKAIVKPQTTRRKATVQNVDKDGTIWVNLPGSSTVTPIQSTGVNVSPGDTVLTELRGTSLHITENQTNPAIGENTARSIAKQETQHAEAMAKQAKTIADEANAVAEATNQHFFADDNGAHITDVTQDEWNDAVADNFSDYDPTTKPYHNQLLNSLGILLRTALNNLVSITRSAIAFYDGQGNAASNIVARFGSAGAQIGVSDESHMTLDYHSMQIVDKEGDTFFHVSDLRSNHASTDEYGEGFYAVVTDTFMSNGIQLSFYLSNTSLIENYKVYVDGAEESSVTKTESSFRFTTAPADGSTVTATYPTADQNVKAYTAGLRENGGNIGVMSFAEGGGTTASGRYAHAEGAETTASGAASHAEGIATVASGYESHAEGRNTTASGEVSHAEGIYETASRFASHAEGGGTTASGRYAHAEGNGTIANGEYSHAQNLFNIAGYDNQTVIGKYNDNQSGNAFEIGNGTYENRSNAAAVSWTGAVSASTYALANGSKIIDTATNNIHLITPDAGTSQAEYSVENTGKVYVKTRTRSSSSAAWGAWSRWTKIAG